MEKLILIVVMHIGSYITAQESDSEAVQKTIERFFEGFHQQDSSIIKETVGDNPILQTISKNRQGETVVRTETFEQLIQSILSIPDTMKFQEKIKSYNIQVDGAMANVWTPYEFWLNDTFSHCGVNSFQLFKDADHWKIIYLMDTRRKEGCE